MRPTLAVLAASFIGLTVGAAHAEAVKVSPELTVFSTERDAGVGERRAPGSAPVVMRGSATRRGTVHDGGGYDDYQGPIPVGTGSTLWLTDPATGAIIACEPRRGHRVGSRYIHCFDG